MASWNIYAGGTSAAEGKHSYDLRVDGKQYSISPYTTRFGRHAGYFLSVFPGKHHGHAGISADGSEVTVNSSAASFRSPAAAKSAAYKHMGRPVRKRSYGSRKRGYGGR